MVPRYAEQQQIGAFFKQLDHLITLHQRTLTIDDAKKYIYSFSTRRRVYKWAVLSEEVSPSSRPEGCEKIPIRISRRLVRREIFSARSEHRWLA